MPIYSLNLWLQAAYPLELTMNIFILSEEREPLVHYHQQAHYHIDKHVVKMIAESVQMLVTSLSFHANYDSMIGKLAAAPQVSNNLPCKPLSASMTKHPCTVWTASSIINTNYLACLALQLCQEHQYRYPLSPQHAYMAWLEALVDQLTRLGFGPNYALPTQFAVAVKDTDKRSIATDHVDALHIYRDYYARDKRGFATWKKRMKPVWFILREEIMDIKAGY